MPRLIPGTELNPKQRQSVLDAYQYRWTVENEARARPLYDKHGGPPELEMVSDEDWLKTYSFWFNKDGRLTGSRTAEYTPTGKEPWRATT